MADDAIWAIILRYARFNRGTGKPLQCEAGSTDQTRHSDGKIAYRNTEAAQHAAAEMERAGRDPQAVYACPRSRHGHAHTTRRGAPTTRDPMRNPWEVPVLPVPPGDEKCPRCGRIAIRPESVAADDPRYCIPGCRKNARRAVQRRERRQMVVACLRGTPLAHWRDWSPEFRQAAEKVKTREEAAALAAAEIARMEEAASVNHS